MENLANNSSFDIANDIFMLKDFSDAKENVFGFLFAKFVVLC